jgi:hypothetical protein
MQASRRRGRETRTFGIRRVGAQKDALRSKLTHIRAERRDQLGLLALYVGYGSVSTSLCFTSILLASNRYAMESAAICRTIKAVQRTPVSKNV